MATQKYFPNLWLLWPLQVN